MMRTFDNTLKKAIFISWARQVPRSRNIAETMGATGYYIEYMKNSSIALIPIRYLFQIIRTILILKKEKPNLIIAMNPPILLPLTIYAYTIISEARFIIDSHTGAFMGLWGRFLWLHRYLSKRAMTTIVTNDALRKYVLSWEAHAFVLEDKLPDLPTNSADKRFDRFSICVINSYSEDEPLEEILSAAKRLPDYDFYITGRIPRRNSVINAVINRGKAANVFFTGFIPDSEYFELLNKVDATMVLVKNDFTMLCGAYESVAAEKPLITSDWPVLKKYFNRGTVFVDNSPNSIKGAALDVMSRKSTLINEMKTLKLRLKHQWTIKFEQLVSFISESLRTPN